MADSRFVGVVSQICRGASCFERTESSGDPGRPLPAWVAAATRPAGSRAEMPTRRVIWACWATSASPNPEPDRDAVEPREKRANTAVRSSSGTPVLLSSMAISTLSPNYSR